MREHHVKLTSPEDYGYNCFAWAGGETSRCWHPSAFACLYWPTGEDEDTLAGFIRGYGALGYLPCSSAAPEPGLEKLAIYADGEFPTHVARQLPNGHWTSKLGEWEDVEHALEALVGKEYGQVALIMSRPAPGQETLLPQDASDARR